MATNNTDINIRIDTSINSAQAATSLREMRTSMRELQGLALQVGADNVEAFNRITAAVGESRDRMNDLNDSIQATSGDPLEKVNNSIGLISSSLSSLDFGGATIGLRSMRENISGMNIGALTSGLKSFASEMLKLGGTLLKNPIFILGAAILLIVTNFDKLKNMGGLVGEMFTFLGKIVSDILNVFTDFTNAIGLTDTKLQEHKDLLATTTEAEYDYANAVIDSEARMSEAQGKSTLSLEWQKRLNTIQEFTKQLAILAPEISTRLKDIKTEQDALNILPDIYKETGKYSGDDAKIKEFIKNIYKAKQDATSFANENTVKMEQEHIKRLDYIRQKSIDKMQAGFLKEQAQLKLETDIAIREQKKKISFLEENAESEQRIKVNLASDLRKEKIREYDNAVKEESDYNDKIKTIKEDLYNFERKRNKSSFDESAMANLRANLIDVSGKAYKAGTRADFAKREEKEASDALFEEIKKIELKRAEETKSGEKVLYDIRVEAGRKQRELRLNEQKRLNELEETNRNEEISGLTEANSIALEKRKQAGEEINQITIEYEDYNQLILKKANEYELDSAEKKFDNLIKMAGTDKKLIESLTLSKHNTLFKIAFDYEKKIIESNNKIKLSNENLAKIKESVARDKENILNDIADIANLATETNNEAHDLQLETLKTEMETLDLRTKSMETHYSKMLELTKDYYKAINQQADDQKQKDIKSIEDSKKSTEDKERLKTEIEDKYSKKRIKTAEEEKKAKEDLKLKEMNKWIDIAGYGSNLYSAMMDNLAVQDKQRAGDSEKAQKEVARRTFERNKNAQYLSTIVNTAGAVMSAYSTAGIAGAVLAGLAGVVQLSTIMSTNYTESSAASGSVQTPESNIKAPEMATPGGGFFGQGFTNQQFNPNDFINGQYNVQSGNQRVYVLESDITNMIRRVAVAEDRNTLRGW